MPEVFDPIRWMDRNEAAAYLGVNVRWIKRAIEEGRITSHKRNRRRLFAQSELDAYIAANRHAARGEAA